MADTKISDMAPALSVLDADLIPIVQAGVNLKATRQNLLTAAPGEQIRLVSQGINPARLQSADLGTYVEVRNGGPIDALSAAAARIRAVCGNTDFDMQASGVVLLLIGPGKTITLGDALGSALVLIDRNLNKVSILSTNQPLITYVPGNPANWILPAPTDLATAIDRIAAAVVAGAPGGPI